MFHPEGESFLEFASIGNLLGSLKYIGAENIYVRECLFCILKNNMLRKVIVRISHGLRNELREMRICVEWQGGKHVPDREICCAKRGDHSNGLSKASS